MKRLTIIFSVFVICFGLTSSIFAQKVKPTPSPTPTLNIPVSASFEPSVDTSNPNRIINDSFGSYVHNNGDGVSALFQIDNGSRDLTINLRNSQTRFLTYDFTKITDATRANAPGWWTTKEEPKQFNFKPGMNIIGAYWAKELCTAEKLASDICDYQARITTIGISVSGYPYNYRLLWNPEPANPSQANVPEATSYVNVHYKKDESGKDVFTITPLPNTASRRLIAGLEATYTGKGPATQSNAGQYEMPFTLVVRPK